MTKEQNKTKERREAIREILLNSDKRMTAREITVAYLLREDVINDSQEFNEMNYRERVNWSQKVRYVLDKTDDFKNEKIGAKRGPYRKKAWFVEED